MCHFSIKSIHLLMDMKGSFKYRETNIKTTNGDIYGLCFLSQKRKNWRKINKSFMKLV